MVFVDFSGSEAPKIHPKSMSKRARKKQRKKTSETSILASILASQNLPKIDPASKNVWLNFMLEIETSGRSATQRNPTETNATQIWSFGWLGLNKGGLWLGLAWPSRVTPPNPPQILSKLSQNPPKTLPNPSGGLPPNRARPKIDVFSFVLRCCCILFNF